MATVESAKSRDKSPLTLAVDSANSKSRDRSPNLAVDHNLLRELVRKRGIIKGRLTKFSNYLNSFENNDDLFSSSRIRIDLKLRIKGAASLYAEFNQVQAQIEECVSDSDMADQLDHREAFENSYYSILAHAESLLTETVEGEVTDAKHCCSEQPQSVKLPTITLPSFDGSYEHWLEFRDTFLSLVHNSKRISNIQKFHYLKSSLKGNAELVVNSVEFSSDNYIVAWELLLNRFNNNRLLVHNHVKALFSIDSLSKESPDSLRKLIDTILKNLRALKILGEPTDQWDTLINYIIVSKLDKTTEREWETHKCSLFPSDNNSKRIIKVNELIGFLKDRADMLETLQLSHSKEQTTSTLNENKKHKSHSHNTSHCNVSTHVKSNDSRTPRFKRSCLKCNGAHPLYSCQQFIDSDLDAKLKLIRDHKLCENCLRSGHAPDKCMFGPCRKCNRKHNSLIHNDSSDGLVSLHSHIVTNDPNASGASAGPSVPAPSTGKPVPILVNNSHTHNNKYIDVHSVLLSTALVEVADVHGVYHQACALLDSGSQRCFITKSFCNILNVTTSLSNYEVRGVGDSLLQCSETCSVEVKSRVNNEFKTRITCFVLSQITSTMPALCQINAQFCIPDNIRLADPLFFDSKSIDILIGADRFWDLLAEGKMRLPTGPYLQNTKLGWIISGSVYNTRNAGRIHCNLSHSLDSQLRLFWELEELPKLRDTQTQEERMCEDHFIHTTTRDSEGRFHVRIPFKESPDVLGESYTQAERRFYALEKRLQRSPDYKLLYTNFMQEYLDLGHMSPVSSYEHPCYFMPHHGVFREHSTTTKLRVVFDASAASTSGKSLNDLQLVGPPIQGDLVSILVRFRQHKFVVCADVQKMFRNCWVAEDQRKLQMILWRNDPSLPLGVYQLNTVTYGTASAPFLSVRCLKQLGIESSDPEIRRVVTEDFYVDDLLTGNDDRLVLLQLCKNIQSTLQAGCFPLRKWVYNFPCPDTDLLVDSSIEIKSNENISTKTLGLSWNNVDDTFYFNTQITANDKPVTKRCILSSISQIFDPLGLLSPTIIIAKVLLQQLWLLKIGWDDIVPSNVARTWNRFVISLEALDAIRVPRHAIGSEPMFIELHVFSDASQTAYGACIYIRTVNKDNTVTVRLLFAKSKVAPLKPISIPRLELCGALLGAKILDKVRSSLRCEFKNIVFWTDSTIVLGWLRMSPNKLKTFVQNRTVEIHELTQDVQWRHVRTKENPADLASRGSKVRTKWTDNKAELKEGALVLIKDSNLPPLKWSMGRVLRTISGKDGIARVADLQTASGVVRRAYAKICPLLQDDQDQ
ncbi:uncharacterized protein LOC124630274 isoform X2 [Helicoverpa zea]|uniref:uncharacterized protein LOC124630274 isoform X2 n=1 Tax=Helicoverpa zea TaxID=7113 RepID=UPI001F58698E|nr:uncharacterized protein LOC124630274 isoform X2 [Helicoverpa zea]